MVKYIASDIRRQIEFGHLFAFIDNNTIFGDVIYNRAQGYRQERIKVKGYRSDEWNGSYNIPGFIFDDAVTTEWESWQDYKIGSLVKNKQYYYVASRNITGSEIFNSAGWVLLNEKPEQQLLPNFDFHFESNLQQQSRC